MKLSGRRLQCALRCPFFGAVFRFVTAARVLLRASCCVLRLAVVAEIRSYLELGVIPVDSALIRCAAAFQRARRLVP